MKFLKTPYFKEHLRRLLLPIYREVLVNSFDLQSKSMDWFLYDIGLRHERVKEVLLKYSNYFLKFQNPEAATGGVL